MTQLAVKRRNVKVIDARPIVQARKKAQALRARRGLVAEWAAIMDSIDADLRSFAEGVMLQISEWLVMRPRFTPQPAISWSHL